MLINRVSTISSGPTPVFEDKIFIQDFKHLNNFKDEEIKKSPTFSANKLQPTHFLISKAFQPLLIIMFILGSLPVQAKKVAGKIFFEYHRCSVVFFYSWATMLMLVVTFCAYILGREFDLPRNPAFQMFLHRNDSHNLLENTRDFDRPSWMEGVDRIFLILIPTFALINLFAVRIRVRPIVEFVNGWAPILQEFEAVFAPFNYKIQLSAIVRAHWLFIPFLGVAYTIPLFKINLNDRRIFSIDNWLLTFWSKSSFVLFIVSAFVLSTVVTVLSLNTINCVYRQIRKAISHQYKETNGRLTNHQVKAWIKLITLVREQVNFFIRFGSLPELNDLLFTFLSILTMSYTAISLFLENMQNVAGGAAITYALGALAVAFFRTYLKGQLADLIVDEEHGIGLDVIEMRVPNNPKGEKENCDDEAYKARFEMSILCNMIFTSPVQIRLSNIISLNKKLLLLIISQLASYLVVFLQFKRSPS